MRISRVKLNNYVCFYDAPEFELGPGINFVVGRNNSGKTALLDALSPGLERDAHRSVEISSSDGNLSKSLLEPAYDIVYDFSDLEVKDYVKNSSRRVEIPVLEPILLESYPMSRQRAPKDMADGVAQYIASRLGKGLSAKYLFRNNQTSRIEIESLGSGENRGVFSDFIKSLHLSVDNQQHFDWTVSARQSQNVHQEVSTWMGILDGHLDDIFRFQSDRMVESSCSPDEFFDLKSDASNLPQILHSLKNSNEHRFGEYLQLVQSVQSDIRQLLTPVRQGQVSIEISQYVPSQEAVGFMRPLSECGSGVSHILAILYVVAFYDKSRPRVIIIDEPNSFLHPGAVRELLRIFEEHDHHQYIIATHSPTAIMSVQKKRILLVQREDMVSTVKSVAVDSNENMEEALQEIGSKRSDIFGMDAVIWVEGKTDAKCFNLIMRDRLPGGVQIMNVINPDDLMRNNDPHLVEQIYERLSGGVGIIPSALAFIYDGDKRPDDYDARKTRKRFLKRWNYENYLLEHPGVIAEVLNEKHVDRDQTYKRDQVADWIEKNRRKANYYADGLAYDEASWLHDINGAKFMKAMFRELTINGRPYNKTKFGPILTRRILESDPDHFCDIVKLIKCILHKDSEQ